MTLQISRTRQLGLFEQPALPLEEAIELFLINLQSRLDKYKKMIVAYSGGKDSTTTATLVTWAVKNKLVKIDPEQVYIVYSDTGQELPPLHDHAMLMLSLFEKDGFNTRLVGPPVDDRFFVQMLGRGLPTPGGPFRWCVGKLKVKPIETLMPQIYAENGDNKLLVITGVRVGESEVRDDRIFASCSRDGECGSGLFEPQGRYYDRFAPLLHWRTCQVFDWLSFETERHGYPTRRVSQIYGEEDIRTGCNACPVATHDYALERAIKKIPECANLAPLLRLRELWETFRTRRNFRLHNDGTAKTKRAKDLGPLTFEARAYGLDFIDGLQAEINRLGGTFQIIKPEERERIIWHWENSTWPEGWDGSQPVGNALQLVNKTQMQMFGGTSEFEMFGA